MGAFSGSREFQESCVERLKAVLRDHGVTDCQFRYLTGELPCYVCTFSWGGREYDIEVYEDGPVMLSGDQLFESYMREEFASHEALREGFAKRLDRYLSGGLWEGPDEPGFWESVGDAFKLLMFWRR